jgi:5-methylcytosine-specific restriction endonuclease McrA
MGKKLPYTPASRITTGIRRVWTRSRERAKVLKKAKYTCCQCGAKKSRAKGKEVYVEVHHKKKIDWKKIVEYVRKEVLDKPQECLCKKCHRAETDKQNAKTH